MTTLQVISYIAYNAKDINEVFIQDDPGPKTAMQTIAYLADHYINSFNRWFWRPMLTGGVLKLAVDAVIHSKPKYRCALSVAVNEPRMLFLTTPGGLQLKLDRFEGEGVKNQLTWRIYNEFTAGYPEAGMLTEEELKYLI